MKNKKVIEILKQLISIPSWVNEKTKEEEIGNWIMTFLSKNSNLRVSRQAIGNDRFNIIATNSNKIDILVTGHMDTVQPNSAWRRNPIKPEIVGNNIYGLGTSDMKSGIAVMLYLAINPNLKKNIGFLFYCDEEYDFLGMKKFIKEYRNKIKPKLVISLDGEGLQIRNSCRGLIELEVAVEGKAGHAAKPESGTNSILESQKVITKVGKWLKSFSTKELGNSTLNIAYFKGGTKIGTSNGEITLGKEGNIIADYAEYIIEVRVACEDLNALLLKEFIVKESIKLGLKILSIKVRHNLGIWTTKRRDLEKLIQFAPDKKLKSAKKSGYIDIQMLWKAFGKVTTFSFGVGENDMSHKPNEYVKISNILTAQKFFKKAVLENT